MSGRVVIVTGTAGGIGSAIAAEFTSLGDTVVGLDLVDGFDVTEPAQCQAAAQRAHDAHGRVDVLCNNAGIGAVGDVERATVDEWQRVFAVNVFGIAHLSAAVLPMMRRARAGAIVNTCSVAADVGLVERAVYSASKGAVLGLTRAMAADEAEHGIRVNCVSPGTVDGPWVRRLIEQSDDPVVTRSALERRQPLGRLVAPEEVAKAVAFLAADTTFTTGQDLLLDGGITGVRIVR
ncbi:MAG TPA: SDR family oxidoreductase [Acidimicrobiales bacterium]|jgi:2-keto-3-deoxy-L-fuconate dehydrogenase|nr:SDR family oxidoreductase [Acidimicrobiales bacterium]